jgi:hypothetical protein
LEFHLMATKYPAALDDSSNLPNPAAGNATNSPSHASQHGNVNDAVKAIETKVGTGASVPAVNTLLVGTGAGTSSWSQLTSAQLAAILTDETGSGSAVFANTPVLITPKIDTIQENTLNNGVTVGGVNLKSGALNTANSVPSAAIQTSAVGNTQLAVGVPVQIVSTNFSAVATGTTQIPLDDTIPQITEGDQYMTQTITPKSATNRLSIEMTLSIYASIAEYVTAAIFQDTTANAVAATVQYQLANMNLKLTYDMLAGAVTPTTFRLRAGLASPGTLTFNGRAGARLYGGISLSNMKITEYKA